MKRQRLTSAAYLAAFLCLAAPAHADWVRRVTDGIMGTRITVELWADDETPPTSPPARFPWSTPRPRTAPCGSARSYSIC